MADSLLDYCLGEIQEQLVSAYLEHGCNSEKAATAIGKDAGHIRRAVRAVRNRATKQGYSPEHDMEHPVPDGFKLKGTSTLYDEDGNKRIQWVKSTADQERQEQLIREAFEAMSAQLPREKPTKAPKPGNADLLNCYVITDFHLGALAWWEECGADWDVKIAEDLLVGWFRQAIDSAPQAQTALLAQIGDMLHFDGLEAITPTSKHILDSDTRFQKVVRVAIRVLRHVVRMLLEKYPNVHLIMADANHDPASGAWLREWFHSLYEDEPRVSVDRSPDTYYCYEHGDTSLFFHHGHRKKPNNIDHVFAAKFREVFGRTKHSYAHMGHLHHIDVKETNLMIVEQHRTLAARDAYASHGGYLAGRSASVVTYSKKYGEVGRITINPDMVRDAA